MLKDVTESVVRQALSAQKEGYCNVVKYAKAETNAKVLEVLLLVWGDISLPR